MTQRPSQYENLEAHVNCLLHLLDKESSLRGQHDTAAIKTSRDKAIDPRFEIVFAGTYSAGKSMLINALLGQDLLYSSKGHATGIECYIEFAKLPKEERVELTFLSVLEVQEEVNDRCKALEHNLVDITKEKVIEQLKQECQKIIDGEGGAKNTEKAEEANGLRELLEGFQANRKYINQSENRTYGMEELGFSLRDAHNYARRGSSSAILKRILYYCHHPLLEDGNVLVDLPGIDAPVQRDAQLTYRKVEDANTSAVICVMKADQEGETETAEKKLIKAMRENPGIRDRVFYVFNRIDKTWRDPKLKQELDDLINENFNQTLRGIYETSALLGFWASQLKNVSTSDRWGLDTIFEVETKKGSDGVEGTPSFVLEFLDYCDSDKLPRRKFRILRDNALSKNEQYIEILNLYKDNIIEQLLQDSGIQEFSNAITRYLTEEKRLELFANLASDLSELCNDLSEHYIKQRLYWKNEPANITDIAEKDLAQISKQLWELGEAFYQHIESEIQQLVMDVCEDFKKDFNNLHYKMEDSLTELIEKFSVLDAFANACRTHRHVTAPLVAVLGEAFYYVANGLEDVLIKESEALITSFFHRLIKRIRKQEYYRSLRDLLLGDDCGIIQDLQDIEKRIVEAIKVLASAECVFYIVESPDLYDYEDSVWLYQFRETLQEASKSRDVKRMVEAEASIRQLLKIDFEAKFNQTIEVNFGSKIIKMLSKYLLSMADKKRQLIWQNSELARANKRQAIEKEAQAKIDKRKRKLQKFEQNVFDYNQAITGINICLDDIKLSNYRLPTIYQDNLPEDNLSVTPTFVEIKTINLHNITPESASSLEIKNDLSEAQDSAEISPLESENNLQENYSIKDPLLRPKPPSDSDIYKNKLNQRTLVCGQVIDVTEYVVYIDVDEIKGGEHYIKLDEPRQASLYIKNVSDGYIESLPDFFESGERIKAIILEMDDGKGKISLSTKVLELYKGELLKNKNDVMAAADVRFERARKKIPKT